jgi:hypothetical protein
MMRILTLLVLLASPAAWATEYDRPAHQRPLEELIALFSAQPRARVRGSGKDAGAADRRTVGRYFLGAKDTGRGISVGGQPFRQQMNPGRAVPVRGR